jgi:hypothetical protein
VLLAKQLDWEKQQEYNLTISVTDGVHLVYTQVIFLCCMKYYVDNEICRPSKFFHLRKEFILY